MAQTKVTKPGITDDAVTTDKILDNNVTVAKLPTTLDISGNTVTLPASVSGLGTGITNAQLAGSITDAKITGLSSSKLTGALPAISGAALTALNATNIGSGTVPTARLGTGTADATTFLRGDQTYAAAGGVDTIWDLTKDGDQASIANNTVTKITSWTSVTDTDSAWDDTNNKIVIPAGKGGKYLISASIYQEQAGGNNSQNDTYTLSLRKNGSAFVGDCEKAQVASNSGTNHLTAILDLAATDYLEIYVQCSAGAGTTTVTDVTALITQPANTWSGARLAS